MKSVSFLLLMVALFLCVPAFAHDITESDMETWGRHAAMGETDAIDKIDEAYAQLYKDIDYQKEMVRGFNNHKLMKIAFDKITQAVKGDETNPAFQSLIYATGKPNLAVFTADAFGNAAAAGHEPSLDVLLHYKDHSILYSSAVIAMVPVAATNNKEAVDFLVSVINDESCKGLHPERGLWRIAAEGLVPASHAGDADAKDAIDKYMASINKPAP